MTGYDDVRWLTGNDGEVGVAYLFCFEIRLEESGTMRDAPRKSVSLFIGRNEKPKENFCYLWALTPRSTGGRYRRFGGARCLHLLPFFCLKYHTASESIRTQSQYSAPWKPETSYSAKEILWDTTQVDLLTELNLLASLKLHQLQRLCSIECEMWATSRCKEAVVAYFRFYFGIEEIRG